MGEQRVTLIQDEDTRKKFMKSLLEDIQAMEYMLNNDWYESDKIRVGAEQEMVIVDLDNYKPQTIAVEVLESLKQYDWVTSELAKFNLEINLNPHDFGGDCFSKMLDENKERLRIISKILNDHNADLLLTGILPTLKKTDVDLKNLMPLPRYKALMDALSSQVANEDFQVRLEGIDELIIKHDSPLIEACNTSFQVHLQVIPDQFVKMYNIAQAITGPVMAIAANSPLVFGRRLWHESRIAMFQQSVDTRGPTSHMRQRNPRVYFGDDWIESSILDIYREDIARFRALLTGGIEEQSLALISENKVPKLRSLQIHNSTVYRWNRPCFGISDNGKPHLRIENRVFAAGPTVEDEMANMTFWLGLMQGMALRIDDIRDRLSFADVRDNFEKAAKFGIDTQFNWFEEKKHSATELILHELLPIAQEGLRDRKVNQNDIDRFLGLIEKRAMLHHNGARWALRSYTNLLKQTNKDEALSAVTCAMMENGKKGNSIVEWPLADLKSLRNYDPTELTVSDCMSTNLYTLREDDIIQLAVDVMDWRGLRYLPVEDQSGKIVGMVTTNKIIKYFSEHDTRKPDIHTVDQIMIKDPIVIDPSANIMDARKIMRENKIGGLPVTIDQELIGIITETDFVNISARLWERLAENNVFTNSNCDLPI